ncbi:MAG: SUMF1/EgtB/PvdO family nonheme iron enzyme [Deltaproteobacteria bacterium]|nr:SUMF1/EgtB/PvdO family nonheme iron enzyme [Deltaproteobacteria bacterium]
MGEDPTDLIDGRYALRERLGEGAYGEVWRAEDTLTEGRSVAVKVLKAEVVSGPEALLRFHNEARALEALDDPYVVRLYARGSWQGRRFLVLEWVPGPTLQGWLEGARGLAPWPREEARALFAQVCEGVAAAHAVREPGSIVHRDLKPANVLLGTAPDGARVAKVTDFGLARLGERQLTRTGARLGTLEYMAPEQATGLVDAIGPQTDVFALAVLLVELLTGERAPLGGAEPWWALSLRAEETVRSRLAALPGDVPGAVWDTVAWALRRSPGARPADASALGRALREAWEGTAPAVSAPRAEAPRATPPRARARLATVALLGAAGLLALAVALSLRARRRDGARATASSGPCPSGMAPIPAGRFPMGSPSGTGPAIEHPQREVSLRAYCLDRTEVTVARFREAVARGALGPVPATPNWTRITDTRRDSYARWCNLDKPGRDAHPINCVDWQQALDYCRWRGARLPTEAEWEYAATGGDGRRYPWGSAPPTPERLNGCGDRCLEAFREGGQRWTALYSGDDGWATTAPVGRFPEGASPFGVLDLAGNVWEWTADWLGPYPRGADTLVDPTGAPSGTARVNRGGGWDSGDPSWLRATERNGFLPTYRGVSLGFRCARSL